MAVRDRNLSTWQAYVLTMSFVSVLLLLGMFFLWRSYSDLGSRFATLTAAEATAKDAALKSEARVRRLQSMLGYGSYTTAELESMRTAMAEDPILASVEKKFAEDMKVFDPTVADAEKNYVTLPSFLIDTMRQRNNELAAGRAEVGKLQKEVADRRVSETNARKAADDAKAKAIADLESSRAEFAKQMKASDDEKTKILRNYNALLQKYTADLDVLKKSNSELDAERKKQLATIEEQLQKINGLTGEGFTAPSGTVTQISLGTDTIWIDIGSEDGLREGIPFSVIDESELNVAEGVVKAKLVISKVLSAHQAQARITSSNFRRPIVPGDKVFSPLWRPGRKQGFALVGLLDMNNDGSDDRQSIIDLINRGGGQVDAEISTNGSVTGTLTNSTAYIVMGTDIETKANATPTPQQLTKLKAYKKFIDEAKSLGIVQINIDKLIGFLRSPKEDRTVPLGGQVRGSDFPASADSPATISSSQGSVSDIFQKRRPDGK